MPRDWIDGHLDLAYVSMSVGDLTTEPTPERPRGVSLDRLRRGRVGIVAATIFVDPTDEARGTEWGYGGSADWEGANRAALAQIALYEGFEREGRAKIVRTLADLSAVEPLKLVILMEGADPIRNSGDAARWHAMGVRMVGLSWARGSRFSGGNGNGGPLTREGLDLIHALDGLGIVHDASHLSDESFDLLASTTDAVIVASHSNSRALLPGSKRHIRDDQVREIARRGGVVGLNLCGNFLAEGRPATLADAIDHVEHIARAAGTRAVSALGSDLDGGFPPDAVPEGVRQPDHYDALTDALAARGWSEAECDGFAAHNWIRVLRRALAACPTPAAP
ncbi:MAG: hypothetical protein EXS03_07245 [Phycisphaerales bacterium]|nr:hypothetical protein [Phycisphaerales bacterium]